MVVTIQIKTRIMIFPLRKEYFSMIATPAGTKKKAIFANRNSEVCLIDSVLITLVIRRISSRIILIRLAGNVNGSRDEIPSPTRHSPKIIKI